MKLIKKSYRYYLYKKKDRYRIVIPIIIFSRPDLLKIYLYYDYFHSN